MTVHARKTLPYFVYGDNEQELVDFIKQVLPKSKPIIHKSKDNKNFAWLALKEQVVLFDKK